MAPEAKTEATKEASWGEIFAALGVQIVGLVEIMYTIYNFDEDTFGVVYIALVFYLQPFLMFVGKYSFESIGGDAERQYKFGVVFEFAAEILQFILYARFCSWQSRALVVLGICTGLQSILILTTYCIDSKSFKLLDDCGQTCVGLFISAVFEGVGIALLFIPGDTPFKEKTYEVPFALMCWLTSVFITMANLSPDPEDATSGSRDTLSQVIFGPPLIAIVCMIPYTALLTAHFYAEWAFPRYILLVIFASICLCSSLCVVGSVIWIDDKEVEGQTPIDHDKHDHEELETDSDSDICP